MNKKQFNEMKIKAEMYALMNVPNRIRLFAISAFEDGKWKKIKNWDWDINNPDVKMIDGIVEFQTKCYEEVESALDCFFIAYYNCNLYSGDNGNPTVIPWYDMDINSHQVRTIARIIANASNKAFNDEVESWICSDDDEDIVDDCLKIRKKKK